MNQNIEDGTATTSDGIGELMIDFPKEGYYSCEITMDKVTSLQYAGLFNAETTATGIYVRNRTNIYILSFTYYSYYFW